MARSEVYLWSRLLALRSRSTALSKSLLFKASAPSRASLFASVLPFACLPPCAWATGETQADKAMITVRMEFRFMFLLDVNLIREFETEEGNSWLQVQQFQVCSGEGAWSMSIFGSGSGVAGEFGPGSSTRVMRTARPVASSISMSAPRRRTSPPATGNDAGRFDTNRFMIGSIARPRMEFTGPHMPASHKKAVPPGK